MENSGYSIGHLRMKYLDLANIRFAQGDYIGCKHFIDNFLDTVDENSDAGKIIKDEFDKIHHRKQDQEHVLQQQIKDVGYLEQRDMEKQGREEIEINAIHDMKAVCWCVSMQHGLFYDK